MNNNEIIELSDNNLSENSLLENDLQLINQSYQCRICLEDEYDLDSLIAPCRCSGTSRFVHKTCLRRWRHQDLNSSAFYKCMECNEDYIILNNIEPEDEDLFNFFNKSYYIFNFQSIVSLLLGLFILFIDTYVNNYRFVKIFPTHYNNSVIDAVKEDYMYENIFYLNFGIYLQNLLFIFIYLLRCSLFVKNKMEFTGRVSSLFCNILIYYNGYWFFMYMLLFYQMVGTSIFFLFFYQTFSFKVNYLLIDKHNISAMIINSTINTSVAPMERNPLNIIIDAEVDEDIVEGEDDIEEIEEMEDLEDLEEIEDIEDIEDIEED